MACDVLSGFKLVNFFSRYRKIAFKGTTEKNVLGLEFQVGIHFVRRNGTNLKYRSCGECAPQCLLTVCLSRSYCQTP